MGDACPVILEYIQHGIQERAEVENKPQVTEQIEPFEMDFAAATRAIVEMRRPQRTSRHRANRVPDSHDDDVNPNHPGISIGIDPTNYISDSPDDATNSANSGTQPRRPLRVRDAVRPEQNMDVLVDEAVGGGGEEEYEEEDEDPYVPADEDRARESDSRSSSLSSAEDV